MRRFRRGERVRLRSRLPSYRFGARQGHIEAIAEDDGEPLYLVVLDDVACYLPARYRLTRLYLTAAELAALGE